MTLFSILLALLVIVSLALVGLVLIQHGKGADMGAAFGSGASATVFGSGGSGSFVTRLTGILATAFFSIALALSWLASRTDGESGIMSELEAAAPVVVEEKILPPVDSKQASDVPRVDELPPVVPGADENNDMQKASPSKGDVPAL